MTERTLRWLLENIGDELDLMGPTDLPHHVSCDAVHDLIVPIIEQVVHAWDKHSTKFQPDMKTAFADVRETIG